MKKEISQRLIKFISKTKSIAFFLNGAGIEAILQ